MSILIAASNTDRGIFVRDILRKHFAVNVVSYSTWDAFTEALDIEDPELIVLDGERSPYFDMMLSELKTNPSVSKIPLVILTSSTLVLEGMNTDTLAYISAGNMSADDLSRELTETIQALIGDKQPVGMKGIEVEREKKPTGIPYDSETLALVYDDTLRSFGRLIDDINLLDGKANQIIQLDFLVVGLLLTLSISDITTEWSKALWIAILILLLLFTSSGTYVVGVLAYYGQYFEGSFYPSQLNSNLTLKSDDVKYAMLRKMAESYEYNHQQYLNISTHLNWSRYLQILAMCLSALIATVVIIDLVVR